MTTTKTIKICMIVLFLTVCASTYLDHIRNLPIDFWTIGAAVIILGLGAYAIKYEPDDEDGSCRIIHPAFYRNAGIYITYILVAIMVIVTIILFAH